MWKRRGESLTTPRSETDTATSRRDQYLKRTYGITLEEYERVLDKQGGGCYGCGKPHGTRSLHVDHSHKTNIVRGILCPWCNSALQKLRDDPEIARNLASYLESPPAAEVLGERLYLGKPRPRRRRRKKKP